MGDVAGPVWMSNVGVYGGVRWRLGSGLYVLGVLLRIVMLYLYYRLLIYIYDVNEAGLSTIP